jgi:hypothetical protein
MSAGVGRMNIAGKRGTERMSDTCVRYVAVRQAQGEAEWFDLATVGGAPHFAQMSAKWDNAANEIWAKANPVKRIAKIEIREIKE